MGTPLLPISTKTVECQDCYKCVRNCPVKAIAVKEGHARITEEMCIFCGNCVTICPTGAKHIREDLDRAKQLVQLKSKVIVSLAPSFRSEFPGVEASQMIAALKKLGVAEVSETALGAQEVSSQVAALMESHLTKHPYLISSSCPVIVQLINKYYPEYRDYVTPLFSPVLAHAQLLKTKYAPDARIIFVSPCIAKKWESDTYRHLIDVAITFEDLRVWFKESEIELQTIEKSTVDFYPHRAEEGGLYPIEGGMIAGIKANCGFRDINYMAFSGIEAVKKALDGLTELPSHQKYVIELLACEGGCVNGPVSQSRGKTAVKRVQVIQHTPFDETKIPRKPEVDITTRFEVAPVQVPHFDDKSIAGVLQSLGKNTKDDELNCGGCGYNSCRDLAVAILRNMAEPNMCVSYMKKLAQRKAEKLLEAMPSAAVIVDETLHIVQANRAFAEYFSCVEAYEASPGLAGAALKKVYPHAGVFHAVLTTNQNVFARKEKAHKRVFLASIFVIEQGKLVGAIFQDITSPVVQREQIIANAKRVLKKNLTTVQKIASLLGESASETEVTLNSIIESFDVHGITDITDTDDSE